MTRDSATAARELASSTVAGLAERDPNLVEIDGIDLRLGLEQQLFFVARDRPAPAVSAIGVARDGADGVLRLAAASIGSLLGAVPLRGSTEILILVREPAHYSVLQRLAAELQRLGGPQPALLRVGRAARIAPVPDGGMRLSAPRLAAELQPASVVALAAFQAQVAARLDRSSRSWPLPLRRAAARELPRIALGAIALRDAARRRRARLLVGLDEVGTWARILPAVARRLGIGSLDLPHSEAADAVAIRGAGYDRMAVYGDAAERVLREAGIVAQRIVAIGAPRFDPLIDRPLSDSQLTKDSRRRVVYAEQYVTGPMTADVMRECRLAAEAVADAVAAELVVVPHPTADGDGDGLHAALPGAWAMVTGWSNSVFEAAIVGVPAIALNPRGVAPIDYAAEGLALGAGDAQGAAAAARLLLDPQYRDAAIARAREVLPSRIGPLDGAATERAARVMLGMIGADVGGPL